jgi:L-threonylcarbamoyladenylate synthase
MAALQSGGAGVDEMAAALGAGIVLAIPTESSYGLAADPLSQRGVDRVLALKGREPGKPLLVLCAGRSQLDGLGIAADPGVLDRFFAIWPAPLTVVLPLARPIPASCGAPSLAVRVPAHEGLRAMLSGIGPVTGTSLNRSGQPPCVDPDEIVKLFEAEVDVLVDGGRTPGGAPSTLLDATADPPRVLREGAFAWPPS